MMMELKKGWLILTVIMAGGLLGCNERRQVSGLTFNVREEPFSLEISQGQAGTAGSITGEDRAGLFFVVEQDTQYVTVPEEVSVDKADHFQASYETSDNHSAEIEIRRQDDGSVSLVFTVTPAEDVQRKGVSFEAFDGEAYYGLMERTVDGPQQRSWEKGIDQALDLRGQKLTMFVKPTLSIYTPFYVSSRGYGVYVDGTWPGEYDMAASNSEQVSFSFEGPRLDVTLIPGPNPVDAVQQFNARVGPPILPPKWTFSVFHWRDDHSNLDTLYDGTKNTSPYNSMVTEDILMLDALDIPNGVYWVDRPWAVGPEGYSDFKWDPERFPKAEQMIDWLHSKDTKFLLWIAPWVMGEEMFAEAEEQGYLIPGSRRRNLKIPRDVRQLLDYSNPDAVEWWGTYMKRIIDDGVDGYKMDRSEEMMPDTSGIVLDNDQTARQLHNKYPVLYMKGAYDVTRKYRQDDDFLLMPRAAYTGSRKYGGFWGGDIATGPWGLRAALIAVQRSAYLGLPYWGSDTGGYWGDFELYSHENLSRWLAFSCFTPIMEVGPLWNQAVWNMPKDPSYDPELIATYRLYATIHTNVMDYSYAQAQKAHNEGTPIVRPMSMAFPDDEEATGTWDQYMYGPDILVGIIWENDVRERTVYLPRGSWTDAWTGETYEGPREVTVPTPRHKIPIFLREGSDVELGDLNAIYNESVDIAKEKPDLKQLLENEEF